MKPFIILILLASLDGYAQDSTAITNTPPTHIKLAENATFQNNSQFYNKDNKIGMENTSTGNGTYIPLGYSNNVNRGSNTNPLGREQNNNNNAAFPISTVVPIILNKDK